MNIRFLAIALLASLFFNIGLISSDVIAGRARLRTQEEKSIVKMIKSVDPAVVSVVVSKNLPVFEQYYEEVEINNVTIKTPRFREVGSEKQQTAGGTAFFVSRDGLLLTNNHLVNDETAFYTIVTNKGESYQAQVLQRDPELDLALLKVASEDSFPIIRISSSDTVEVGQTVVAIGNALAEYRNTVSKGIISGVSRNIEAQGNFFTQVIQTDAAINTGNSGGPLLNTRGELIGVNFSTVSFADAVGFAIPIDSVKEFLRSYDQNLLKLNKQRAPRIRE